MFITYQNGNYKVLLNIKDGTKIRFNKEEIFSPHRPESIDVKITNQCQHQCVMCHENSSPTGKLASVQAMKNFIYTLPPYTEIAVGGGNIMQSYKHTEMFLKMLKKIETIPSITVTQKDFIEYLPIIKEWKDAQLIYGIGVSYTGTENDYFFSIIKDFPTAVIHIIAGMLTEHQYQQLKNHNLKILILGYKVKGRGQTFWREQSPHIVENITMLKTHFKDFKNDFDIVAFDNLALEQLEVKKNVPAKVWDKYFLGDDGQYTFYIDLVKEEFAQSSTSLQRMNIDNYSILDMFNIIRKTNLSKNKEGVTERYDSI